MTSILLWCRRHLVSPHTPMWMRFSLTWVLCMSPFLVSAFLLLWQLSLAPSMRKPLFPHHHVSGFPPSNCPVTFWVGMLEFLTTGTLYPCSCPYHGLWVVTTNGCPFHSDNGHVILPMPCLALLTVSMVSMPQFIDLIANVVSYCWFNVQIHSNCQFNVWLGQFNVRLVGLMFSLSVWCPICPIVSSMSDLSV